MPAFVLNCNLTCFQSSRAFKSFESYEIFEPSEFNDEVLKRINTLFQAITQLEDALYHKVHEAFSRISRNEIIIVYQSHVA